jgi:hypothetical protein
MGTAPLPLAPRRFLETGRTDMWWFRPVATFVALAAFLGYSTWAAFQGNHYTFGPYLSPFYSPEIFGDPAHAWFGGKPGWWPGVLPFSPAFLILWAPGGFRLTCYYYRGAYYKAMWADPVNCSVGEPRSTYLGERHFPLILQNIHRYFLYLAIPFLGVLSFDLWKAMWFTSDKAGHALGQAQFGIGVGTLVLAVNLALLGSYTFGCHSFRHLIGGVFDRISERPLRRKAYACSSCLNRAHEPVAWSSLVMVGFADLYIRLCSMGVWTDWRLF